MFSLKKRIVKSINRQIILLILYFLCVMLHDVTWKFGRKYRDYVFIKHLFNFLLHSSLSRSNNPYNGSKIYLRQYYSLFYMWVFNKREQIWVKKMVVFLYALIYASKRVMSLTILWCHVMWYYITLHHSYATCDVLFRYFWGNNKIPSTE